MVVVTILEVCVGSGADQRTMDDICNEDGGRAISRITAVGGVRACEG